MRNSYLFDVVGEFGVFPENICLGGREGGVGQVWIFDKNFGHDREW